MFSYQVWDPPGIATFTKKIDSLRPTSASGTLYRTQNGHGTLTLPAAYNRLNEIVYVDVADHSNDVASLIRVYRGSDLIQELLVERTPDLIGDEPMVLACDGIEACLDWAVVEAFDWDGTADSTSTVADWIYGGRNLIPELALGDLGSIREQWEVYTTATGGTWTATVDGQTTNNLDYNASLDDIQGSPLTGNGLEGLSTVDDVTVSGAGTSDDPWVITFFAPPAPAAVSFSGAGLSGGTLTSTQTVSGDEDPYPFTQSQTADAGIEPGVHGEYGDPPVEVVSTPLDTGADWSLLVNATGRYAGTQVVLPVTAGQTYQAAVRLRPTVTADFTLVIRDEFENLIAEVRDVNLTAGSFQELAIADVQIPPGVSRVIFRVAVTDATPANVADFYVNWQLAEFFEGQAATTLGQIMLDLLAHCQTTYASAAFPRETLAFVNADFTASVDTAGNAWTDSELRVNIPRGMTYRKVLDRIFGQLGYEWALVPASTSGEWDLQIWNPDGRGTDWTAQQTPSILLGQGVTDGGATRQIPNGNIIISEGGQQYFSRAANSASYGTVGRREWYQADISYTQSEVEAWTDRQLSRFLSETLAPRYEIADPNPGSTRPVPVVDYGLGDLMNVDVQGAKVARRVESVSWRDGTEGTSWGVQLGALQFSSTSGGRFATGPDGQFAAQSRGVADVGPVYEGVRRLIDQYDRLQLTPQAVAFGGGGGGGMAHILVVSTSEPSDIQAKADFVVQESNAAVELQAVLDTIPTSSPWSVWLAGWFELDSDLDLPAGVWLRGLGYTRAQCV